jgi:DNA polymerase delta subunit 1
MAKKRYAGLYWTNIEKPDKIDTRGIEVNRRGSCQWVCDVMNGCLKEILEKRDTDAAARVVRDAVAALYRGEVSLGHLVLRQGMQKSVDPKDFVSRNAWAELVERMHKRDPSTAPVAGDSIFYLFVQPPPKASMAECIEDRDTVIRENLAIDASHYKKMLERAIGRLFVHILPPQRIQELWVGDHTRVRRQSAARPKNGILKFCVTKSTCMTKGCCGKDEGNGLCLLCQPKHASLLSQSTATLDAQRKTVQQFRDTCEKCKSCAYDDIKCSNYVCEQFFTRTQAAQKLVELESYVSRLQGKKGTKRPHCSIEYEN